MAAAGAGDGTFKLGSTTVTVTGGRAQVADRDTLAGSTLTLDVALRNAVAAGVPFLDAVAAVTSNPARAIGIANRAGTLAVGRRADLVVLNADLEVTAVLCSGEWAAGTTPPASLPERQ